MVTPTFEIPWVNCLDPTWLPPWGSLNTNALGSLGKGRKGKTDPESSKEFSLLSPHHSTQLTGEMLGLTEQIIVIKIRFLNCLSLGPHYLPAQ
jgi:hypothetical protein